MNVALSPILGAAGQLFNDNGDPLAGGKIFTYLAGTTTPAATYTTSQGNIAHSNPIILDGAGRVPTGEIWLQFNVSYKFVINDSNNVLIGSYDNIGGVSTGANVQNYTGDGTTTNFALPIGATTVYNIFINGVYQNKNTWSIVGGDIVFSEAPPVTSIIEAQV
jgi:hypothetical protein